MRGKQNKQGTFFCHCACLLLYETEEHELRVMFDKTPVSFQRALQDPKAIKYWFKHNISVNSRIVWRAVFILRRGDKMISKFILQRLQLKYAIPSILLIRSQHFEIWRSAWYSICFNIWLLRRGEASLKGYRIHLTNTYGTKKSFG